MSTPIVDLWVKFSQSRLRPCLRLFCFPYAGGGASIFHAWSDALPPDVDMCPIQLPGRESRLLEAPYTQMTMLIEALGHALLPYLDIPYAFFGHSMGALISFELARYLRRRHYGGPVHLFISGHRAPQLPDPDLPIHQLPEQEFLEELRCLQGTPEAVLQNTELLQLLLPVLRADFALCETYQYMPEAPLVCPISTFGGLQDAEVQQNELEAWREQTHSRFKLHLFAGNHFFVQTAQSTLLQVLYRELLNYIS